MFFVLQTANVTADAKNSMYPNRKDCNISNFLKSNVIVMDCDNEHSENPDDWITFEKLEEFFEEIDYAAVPSRSHMKEKDGKAARPKFHVYFPIEETADAEHYAEEASEDTPVSSGPITVGNRNNAMSHFARRVLKKYGITDKAKEAFLEHAKRCAPSLEESELNTIWASAVRFYKKTIVTQPGYISPDEYNAEFDSLKPDDYSDIGEARVLVKEYAGELLYKMPRSF